jgi:hypothetical protein
LGFYVLSKAYIAIELNRHLLERFISLLDLDSTSIKSHPRFPDLCSYGSIVY